MRVLIVSSEFPPGPGGIGDHAFNLAEQLTLNGFETTVLSELRMDFLKFENNTLKDARLWLIKRSVFFHVQFVFRFLFWAFSNRNGLIIASGSKSLALVGAFLYFFKRRSMAVLHGHETKMYGSMKRFIIRKTLHLYTEAVAVSNFSKDNFLAHRADVAVINNGFSPTKFQILDHPRVNASSTLQMLTLGTISKRKGQHNVVRALPTILKKYPDAVYNMAGITDYSAELRNEIAALNLTDPARILGVVPNKHIAELFRANDIFVMLSENTTDGNVEGFGIAIIEANYFGLPAIGSKGCGIEDAVQDRVTGRLVDPHLPHEFLEAIEDIRNNYQTYSTHAKAWAMEHKWDIVFKKYMILIQSIFEKQ